MTKLKQQDWHSRDREFKLASVLYPHLADPETRAEMKEISKAEGRKPPSGPGLLSDSERGPVSRLGGTAINRKGK
jgi:hypothetical protein